MHTGLCLSPRPPNPAFDRTRPTTSAHCSASIWAGRSTLALGASKKEQERTGRAGSPVCKSTTRFHVRHNCQQWVFMNRIILIIAAIVELWLVLLVSSTSLALAGPPTYALNVTPEVNGTITSNPSGINCGNLCSASFSSGTSVILTVSSAAGYAFSGWGGACSGTASSTCFVAMNQVQNVNANFVRLKRSSWKVILPALTRPVLDVVGMTQAAAGTALTGAHLTVGTVTQQCSNTVANGLVISQNPVAGNSAPFGSAVALVVSSGKCPVTAPNTVGMTQAAAGTALTGAHLTVGTVTQQCSNTVANGLVISQNPVAGNSAPFGSAVALVVSNGVCVILPPDLTTIAGTWKTNFGDPFTIGKDGKVSNILVRLGLQVGTACFGDTVVATISNATLYLGDFTMLGNYSSTSKLGEYVSVSISGHFINSTSFRGTYEAAHNVHNSIGSCQSSGSGEIAAIKN